MLTLKNINVKSFAMVYIFWPRYGLVVVHSEFNHIPAECDSVHEIFSLREVRRKEVESGSKREVKKESEMENGTHEIPENANERMLLCINYGFFFSILFQ